MENLNLLHRKSHKELKKIFWSKSEINKACFYNKKVVCDTRKIEYYKDGSKECFNNGNSKVIQLEIITVDGKHLYCGNVHLVKYGTIDQYMDETFTASTLKEFKTKLDNYL